MRDFSLFLNPALLCFFQSTIFTVRNGGHSAGFDEEGNLRIFWTREKNFWNKTSFLVHITKGVIVCITNCKFEDMLNLNLLKIVPSCNGPPYEYYFRLVGRFHIFCSCWERQVMHRNCECTEMTLIQWNSTKICKFRIQNCTEQNFDFED